MRPAKLPHGIRRKRPRGRSAPWDGTVMWIGAVPERYAAAPAAGVGYPAREGLPGEGYPGKFTCPVHRPVVGAVIA